MPLVSKAQQGWMFVHHPKMAKEWADKTPNIKGLPEHVKKSKVYKKPIQRKGSDLLVRNQAEALAVSRMNTEEKKQLALSEAEALLVWAELPETKNQRDRLKKKQRI